MCSFVKLSVTDILSQLRLHIVSHSRTGRSETPVAKGVVCGLRGMSDVLSVADRRRRQPIQWGFTTAVDRQRLEAVNHRDVHFQPKPPLSAVVYFLTKTCYMFFFNFSRFTLS